MKKNDSIHNAIINLIESGNSELCLQIPEVKRKLNSFGIQTNTILELQKESLEKFTICNIFFNADSKNDLINATSKQITTQTSDIKL